ncbi:OmpA family protein [anaerobic digester metagenome]
MRNAISITTIALIIWIAGSSYCYVCHIRDHCARASDTEETIQQANAPVQAELTPEPFVDSTAVSQPESVSEPVADAERYLDEQGTQFIYFEFANDRASIPDEFSEYTGQLKVYLEGNPVTQVSVTGHSDANGSGEANDRCSRRRASFISDYLAQIGIPRSAIVEEGKGDREPIASNDTEEGRSKNRRVEIKIKK